MRGGERLNVHTLLTLSLILAFIFVKWSKMLEHLKNIYIRPQSRCTDPASRTDRPRGRCTEPASEPDFLSFGLDAPQAQTQIIKSVFMFVTYKHMSNNYLASFASVASQSVQTVCVFKGEGAERKMLRKRFW